MRLGVKVAEGVGPGVTVIVPVPLVVPLRLLLVEGETLELNDGVRVVLLVVLGDREVLGVSTGEIVCETLRVPVSVAAGVRVALLECVVLGVSTGERVCETLRVAVSVAAGVLVALLVVESVEGADRVSDAERLGVS